jgi:diphthine-ammonia ligase
MRLAALFTGGKDSTYATHLVAERGDRVDYLVTMVSDRTNSWMFHTTNIRLAPLVAEAMGIEHAKATTSGEKELELDDLRRALSALKVDGVVSGAIASTYQRSRVDRICKELGLRHVTPLWGKNGEELLREMLSAGLIIMVAAVAARGLDQRWLGRILDVAAVEELSELHRRFGVDVCGDGGEMETLVLDAPWFRRRLEIVKARIVWDGSSGSYVVEDARLLPKGLGTQKG